MEWVMGLWEVKRACMLIYSFIVTRLLIQNLINAQYHSKYFGMDVTCITGTRNCANITKKRPLDDLYIWIALNSFIVKLRRGG